MRADIDRVGVLVFVAVLFAVVGAAAGIGIGKIAARFDHMDPGKFGLPESYPEPVSVYDLQGKELATLWPTGKMGIRAGVDEEIVIRVAIARQLLFEQQRGGVIETVRAMKAAYEQELTNMREELNKKQQGEVDR